LDISTLKDLTVPTHYVGDPTEVLALDTWIKLNRSVESLAARINQSDTMGGLTPTQFSVVETLYHLGPLPQCRLAARVFKSSGNMTLVIDNLEKLGLVSRQADKNDRRVSVVALTSLGKQTVSLIFPKHAAYVTELFSRLSPEEQRMLGEILRKLGKQTG
jgi:MarR family 2-MHQ and catechol resistance regulon transcriptional repressor